MFDNFLIKVNYITENKYLLNASNKVRYFFSKFIHKDIFIYLILKILMYNFFLKVLTIIARMKYLLFLIIFISPIQNLTCKL